MERRRIATLRHDGLGVREIAEQLGRSLSTVSRELRRNTAAHDHSYGGDLAHARARERARRPRRGRLLVDLELRAQEARLELEWSPEQIPGWLRTAFPDRLDTSATRPSTRRSTSAAGRATPPAHPSTADRPAAAQAPPPRHRATTRFVTPGQLIDQRPEIVLRRERIGDWEGHLIIGRGNRSAIAPLVESTQPLPATRTAA